MSDIEFLKELNVAFENQPRDVMEEAVDLVIKKTLATNPYSENDQLTNVFAVISNYIKLIVKEKNVNPNYVLSSAVKHANNYIGLFFIGMLVRSGANPNVYFPYPGYGNLHILAILSLRSQGGYDPYFRYVCNLLRMIGSDINYPAINYGNRSGDMDVNFVERIADSDPTQQYVKSTVTVKDFIIENGKIPNEDLGAFLNSLKDERADELVNFIIASDKTDLIVKIKESNFFQGISENRNNTARFFINLSIAYASDIAREMTIKELPMMNDIVNAQPIPMFASTLSMDADLFSIYLKRGSLVKYMTMNNLIIYYKYFKNEKVRLYKNCYNMILEAITIGADIDLFQFDLLSTSADYNEIDNVRIAFQTPKWKKLCSLVRDGPPRQEIKQMAFELNLDYNMSEEKICNKLKQISLLDKAEYLESAIKRQEERVATSVMSASDYIGDAEIERPRCNPKSMVIQNPYAYSDLRLVWLKDSVDGEVYCFTSDSFTNLIAGKVNPYTNRPLPLKFLETVKAQVNILQEMGVYDTNRNIKDALKEIYERSVINNEKTEYAYNTVIKSLSLFGVSEERFSTLKTITLEDTILRDICGIKVNHFDIMSYRHRVMLTARIIYSLSKVKNINPSDLYKEIAQAIVGDLSDLNNDPDIRENLDMYLDMLRK